MCDPKDPDDDEVDVDVGQADDQDENTVREAIEYLGSYETIADYLRSQLESEIPNGIIWILDCVDWAAVEAKWTADGSRLCLEDGNVYKIGGRS